MTKNTKLADLARELQSVRDRIEEVEEELKNLNARKKEIAEVILPAAMDDMDEDKFSVPGLGTVYLTHKVFAHVKAEDRERLYEWLRETGNGAMVKDWVFPQTLNSFAKDALGESRPLPEFVTAAIVPTATIRRK